MIHTRTRDFLPFAFYSMLILIIGVLVYDSIKIATLTKQVNTLTLGLASTTARLSSSTLLLAQNLTDLNNQNVGISDTLIKNQENIDAVKNKVGGVEQFVGYISNTVGNLQKLAEVDAQLLKKYSKVYFMNENYVPAHLTIIPDEYLYSTTRQEQFLSESWQPLKNLLDTAKANGTTIFIKSGYRSFAEQKSLKTAYRVTYGAGTANAFSADQGYSEHQLGTTIDFITTGTNGELTVAFDKTTTYQWLTNNAYRYGFILSYPKDNKYYVYEPWHWRYVGIKLATYLHNNNLNFYDMDQREIDKYLVNTFDPQ